MIEEASRTTAAVAPCASAGEEVVFLNESRARVELRRAPGDHDAAWYLDTGASNHMTGNETAFAELDKGVRGSVRFGDGSLVPIQGRGTVLFATAGEEHRALTNVYWIPRLKSNIVSIGQLDENGYPPHVEAGVMTVRDRQHRILARVSRSRNRLYIARLQLANPVCLAAHSDDEAWRWHARYGHVNFRALRQLARNDLVRGLPLFDKADRVCEACLTGKQRRAPFPQAALRRAGEVLELVHADLCGPISPPTPGGKRYFLLLVDDKSRFMWLRLLTTKDEAVAEIRHFKAGVEVETGRKLRLLCTERGGEFTAATFTTYCADEGVGRQLTAPYSPQQNGVVERRNQTIIAAARCLMKEKGVPARF